MDAMELETIHQPYAGYPNKTKPVKDMFVFKPNKIRDLFKVNRKKRERLPDRLKSQSNIKVLLNKFD